MARANSQLQHLASELACARISLEVAKAVEARANNALRKWFEEHPRAKFKQTVVFPNGRIAEIRHRGTVRVKMELYEPDHKTRVLYS